VQGPTRLDAWQRPEGARPFVLGHRGARHAAPENTLRAFELALEEGADGVELDVRLDGDGRVIVLHDRTPERVSGGAETRDVEELGATELERVSVGGERVPLLAEVLAWARERRTRVNVELKADGTRPLALARSVAKVVCTSGVGPECVLFSSFDSLLVAALGVLSPALPRAQLVHAGGRLERPERGARFLADGVNPERTLVTRERMALWKRAGAVVATWTVNDEAEARRLADLGVDSIISDEPGKILGAVS
jgi:glycerophosphoryl diester phosphodiesterase